MCIKSIPDLYQPFLCNGEFLGKKLAMSLLIAAILVSYIQSYSFL